MYDNDIEIGSCSIKTWKFIPVQSRHGNEFL